MKTIIVATDFSAESENAARYAASAAAILGSKIILFTLQNISIHALNARLPGSSFDQIITHCNEMIQEAAKKLQQAHEVPVIPYLATGDFYEELERCSSQCLADLVVMGMAGKSLEQDLLGNTTTKLIDRLSIPVLAVPLGAGFIQIKRIMFACDVLRGVQTHVLQQVRNFAKVFGATVEVFHVYDHVHTEIENNLQQSHIGHIRAGFKGASYYYKGVESKRIIEAIKAELLTSKSDLLIMVTHRYGFWNSLIHRSKTRAMAAGSKIPLLSIPL